MFGQKNSIILNIFLLVFGYSYAQNLSPDIQNYAPVSPNSANLGKFGSFPMDNNLGPVNVEVPLYTLNTGKQQVPIGLSYNMGGIKVNDLAPWVGLGWTLNAGGAIIRNVKGIPDSFSNQNIIDLENAPFNSTNFFYMYDCWKGLRDSQPDEFILNAPGIRGTFQLDPDQNGTIVFNDRQTAKINTQTNGRIEVTASDGTRMVFGKSIVEENGQYHDASEQSWLSANDYRSGYSYTSAWYLTEMIAPCATDTIRFRYYANINHDFPEAIGESADASMTPTINGIYPDVQQTDQKILSRIETNNGFILFNSSLDRNDLEGEAKLNSIEVYSGPYGSLNTTKIDEFIFDYGYFQRQGGFFPVGSPNGIVYDRTDSRTLSLRLDGITIGNNGLGGSYSFTYNSEQLPLRGSTAQDQWGYANSNSGSLIPNTSGIYYPNGVPARNYNVGNGDRKADPIKMKAASLEKITYPTGGYTVFGLEPHKRTYQQTTSTVGYATPVSAQAYGPECDENSMGPSYVNKSVEIPNDMVGEVKLAIYFSTAESGGTGAYVEFNGIKYQATGGPEGEELNGGRREFGFNLSPGTYTLIVSDERTGDPEGASTCPFTMGSVSWKVPGPDVNTEVTEYFGGLRTKSIKDYDGIHSEPRLQKYFEYTGMNVLRPFRPEAYKQFYLTPSFDPSLRLSTAEYFNNNLDARPVVEYGMVTEYTLDDGGSESGKTEYIYNTVSPQRILEPGLNGLAPFKHSLSNGNLFYGVKDVMLDDDFSYFRNDDWRYGTLAHKYEYKNTGTRENPVYTKLRKTDNQYIDMAGSEVKSNYVFANIADPGRLSNGQYLGSFDIPYDEPEDGASYVFSYYVAKKSTGKKVLSSSTTENYDESGNNEVTTTTQYFYENPVHLLPTRTIVQNSQGKTITTRTFYPDDITGISALGFPDLTLAQKSAIDSLKTGARHRISEPVQREITVKNSSGNVVSNTVQRTDYKDWDVDLGLSDDTDLILPVSVRTLKGTYDVLANPMQERIVYNKYDSHGNPIELSKADGLPIYYLWGYVGRYPIAKIENLASGDISAVVRDLMDTAVTKSGSDDDNCRDTGCSEEELREALKGLRADLPSDVLMTTYTYDPLVGVTSITDPKGRTIYYIYDSFNRLKEVRDPDGNLVNDYKYHYVIQP